MCYSLALTLHPAKVEVFSFLTVYIAITGKNDAGKSVEGNLQKTNRPTITCIRNGVLTGNESGLQKAVKRGSIKYSTFSFLNMMARQLKMFVEILFQGGSGHL